MTTSGEKSDGSIVVYRLAPSEADRRAGLLCLILVLRSLAPLALVVVLLQRLGYALSLWAGVLIALIVAIVALRSVMFYRQSTRRLRSLEVRIDDDGLRLTSQGRSDGTAIHDVVKIVEMPGRLGGIRLERGEDDAIEIPRGGDKYGAVRERLSSWLPIERRTGRGFRARILLAIAVALGVIFLPFFIEDIVRQSKMATLVFVIGVWAAMRFLGRRGT